MVLLDNEQFKVSNSLIFGWRILEKESGANLKPKAALSAIADGALKDIRSSNLASAELREAAQHCLGKMLAMATASPFDEARAILTRLGAAGLAHACIVEAARLQVEEHEKRLQWVILHESPDYRIFWDKAAGVTYCQNRATDQRVILPHVLHKWLNELEGEVAQLPAITAGEERAALDLAGDWLCMAALGDQEFMAAVLAPAKGTAGVLYAAVILKSQKN